MMRDHRFRSDRRERVPAEGVLVAVPVTVTVSVSVALALTACDLSSAQPDPDGDAVEVFTTLMNEHRVSVGCAPLTWSEAVADVAEAHSADMVQRGFFDHTNPDGESPFDRLADAGIGYSRAAENIAWGHADGASVLAAWLDSSGHRGNIEDCALTQHGVGLVETHWTHVFVTP